MTMDDDDDDVDDVGGYIASCVAIVVAVSILISLLRFLIYLFPSSIRSSLSVGTQNEFTAKQHPNACFV